MPNITATLDQHYAAAVQHLDQEATAYFLTSILNMGEPTWDSTIPTACVSVPTDLTDLKNFSFRFNPEFARSLPVDELAFVAAHETLHIVLNHLALSKTYADKQLFNIAADCVINDWLADQGFSVPEWVMTGDKQVGFDCSNVTVSEVYSALQHRQRQGDDPEAGDPGEGSQNASEGSQGADQGEGQEAGDGQGGAPSGGSLVDDHDWIHNADQRQESIAEAASQQADAPTEVKETKADSPHGGGGYGVNSGGEGRAFSPDASVTLAWESLLRKVNPDVFKAHAPRPSWHRQPRRLASTKTRLPVMTDPNTNRSGKLTKPAIVLALDTSGSIQDDDARRFINLARSIPQKHIKLFPITFTTQARPLDLDHPSYPGGGTEFGCIENYIQTHVVKELGHYPKSVVVITDGMAVFHYGTVADKHKDNWTWLYTYEAAFQQFATKANGPCFGEAFPLTDFTN